MEKLKKRTQKLMKRISKSCNAERLFFLNPGENSDKTSDEASNYTGILYAGFMSRILQQKT